MPVSHSVCIQQFGTGIWEGLSCQNRTVPRPGSRPAELGHNGQQAVNRVSGSELFLQDSLEITSMCSISFTHSNAQLICSQQLNVCLGHIFSQLILKQLTLFSERGDVLPLRSPEDWLGRGRASLGCDAARPAVTRLAPIMASRERGGWPRPDQRRPHYNIITTSSSSQMWPRQ